MKHNIIPLPITVCSSMHYFTMGLINIIAIAVILWLLPLANAQATSPKESPTTSTIESHSDQLTQDMLDRYQGRVTVFEALVELFREHYWNSTYTDWNAWAEQYRQEAYNAKGRVSFERVMRTMVLALDDDHSRWLGRMPTAMLSDDAPAHTYPATFGFSYRNLKGIGIVITHVYANTPALEAGLQRGDVILAIGEEGTQNLSFGEVQTLMTTAREAAQATFHIQRANQALPPIAIEARSFNVEENQRLPTARMLHSSIGYLRLPSFYHPEVAEQTHGLVANLVEQGAEKLVIDMRDNTGGSLSELGLVLGIFLEENESPWADAVRNDAIVWQALYQHEDDGTAVILKNAEGKIIAHNRLNTPPAQFTGDIAIIITRSNSSAGEIMPLVLQQRRSQHRNVYIVGEQTLGNTEIISPFSLPDGSQVMLAASHISLDGTLASKVIPDSHSVASIEALGRGFDAPVAEAIRLLNSSSFTPQKFF